jgi:hypothetical protein
VLARARFNAEGAVVGVVHDLVNGLAARDAAIVVGRAGAPAVNQRLCVNGFVRTEIASKIGNPE